MMIPKFIEQIPVLLILIPFALAFLVPILNFAGKKWIKFLNYLGSASGFVLSIILFHYFYNNTENSIIYGLSGFLMPKGISLYADIQTAFLMILFHLIFFVMSFYIAKEKMIETTSALFISFLGAIGAANTLLLSNDMFNIFIFTEIGFIALLILSNTGKTKKFSGSWSFLIFSSIGAVFLLMGIISYYSSRGVLSLSPDNMMIKQFRGNPFQMLRIANSSSPFTFILSLFFLFGFATELKVFPFSGWVKDLYKNSHPVLLLFLSIIFPIAVFTAFYKIMINGIGPMDLFVFYIIPILLSITILVGEISAYFAKDLRIIFGFSTMAQTAILLAFALSYTNSYHFSTYSPMVIQLIINFLLSKTVIFLSIFEFNEFEVNRINGIYKKKFIPSLTFAVGGLSLTGMPVFLGFWVKVNLLKILIASPETLYLVFVILAASIIEIIYIFKILQKIFFGVSQDSEKAKISINLPVIISLLFSLIIILAGIFQTYFLEFIKNGLFGGF